MSGHFSDNEADKASLPRAGIRLGKAGLLPDRIHLLRCTAEALSCGILHDA